MAADALSRLKQRLKPFQASAVSTLPPFQGGAPAYSAMTWAARWNACPAGL